jgi:hypothetical protein
MNDWRKKFALFLILLLPLQALAASFSALTCPGDAAHQGAVTDAIVDHHTSHENHSHDPGKPHHHDGDAAMDHSGHLNCHHVFSGMPTIAVVNVPDQLPALESSLSLLHTLFVPERPQRPPRP